MARMKWNDFWLFYLSQHRNRMNRVFHFVASSLAYFFILQAIYGQSWMPILYGLFTCYGFAWMGHFFFEKNRPATFRYPLYSFISDFRMHFLMLTANLNPHLKKLETYQPPHVG